MEGRFFLDVIIRQRAAVLQLFSSKNQTLLIRGDADKKLIRKAYQFFGSKVMGIHKPFFVLYLGLYIVNGVRRFYFQGDGLSSERLDENLHAKFGQSGTSHMHDQEENTLD